MKVVLLLFCPFQPLKSTPCQQGWSGLAMPGCVRPGWLLPCNQTSWVRAFLQVRNSLSAQVTTTPHVHCAASHRMVEIRSRLGFPLCFRPSETPCSFAASPRVVFPAGFRKSDVAVTPPVAAITARTPCLQERVPGHGGWLVRGRLHACRQTRSASKTGQDLVLGGGNMFDFCFCGHSSARSRKAGFV